MSSPAGSFSDPQAVARYAEGPRRVVPGYASLHRMVGLLIAVVRGGNRHLREELGT